MPGAGRNALQAMYALLVLADGRVVRIDVGLAASAPSSRYLDFRTHFIFICISVARLLAPEICILMLRRRRYFIFTLGTSAD